MTVQTRCTSCGKQLELADKWDGQKFTCPVCSKPFVVRDTSARIDGSMILDQIKPTGQGDESSQSDSFTIAGGFGGSRLAPPIVTTPHAGLSQHQTPPGGPKHSPVTMDLGFGDESAIAGLLMLVGYGAGFVMQLINLSKFNAPGYATITILFVLALVWVTVLLIIPPITNIGLQLSGKILHISLGPTLFRMYGLLALPSSAAFIGLILGGHTGGLIGLIIGLVLMWPAISILYSLNPLHTLLALLLSAIFYAIGAILYGLLAMLVVTGIQVAGSARQPDTGGPTAIQQPTIQRPSYNPPSVGYPPSYQPPAPPPPPPRIDSIDTALQWLGETDADRRWQAMLYLEKQDINTATEAQRLRVAQAMKDRMDDSQSMLARRAGALLLRWSPTLAVEAYMSRLGDSDGIKRREAMQQLAELGDQRAIDPLVAHLGDEPSAAAAALVRFGAAAEPAVLKALAGDDATVRNAAMDVLARIGTTACLPTVKPLASDADSRIADAAIQLWKKLAPKTLDPITEAMLLMDSSSSSHRAKALKALVAEEYDATRAAAITAKVEALLSDQVPDVAMAAAQAVAKYHRDTLPDELTSWFDQPTDDPRQRKVAIMAMGYMRHTASAPTIVKWLAVEPQVSVDALTLLGPEAEPAIISVMPIRDDKAMTAACKALQQIGSRRSLILLNSAATSRGNAEVRAAAKAARGAILTRLKSPPDTP